METQEVTLHNELKHKSIFLRDFTTAAQVLRQVLRPGCERCLACGHRSGVECRDKGNGVAGNIMSINEISILVVRYWAPRECLC